MPQIDRKTWYGRKGLTLPDRFEVAEAAQTGGVSRDDDANVRKILQGARTSSRYGGEAA
jgi:hypothetical protein